MQFNQLFKQVSCGFHNASDAFLSGCTVVINQGTKANESVNRFACGIFETAKESELWKQQGLPLYNRTIDKLTTLDYFLLGGAAATALAVIDLAVKIFGIGFLPLAAGAGTLIILGAGLIVRERVRSQHNQTAKKLLKDMISPLDTNINNDRVRVIGMIEELKKPEFAHLNREFSSLIQHAAELNHTVDETKWSRICRELIIAARKSISPDSSDAEKTKNEPPKNLATESPLS